MHLTGCVQREGTSKVVPSLLLIGGSVNLTVFTWVIAVLVIVALVLLTRLRAKALFELRQVLYQENNATLYLRLLDNSHLRAIFSKRTLAELRTEGERVMQRTNATDGKDG